MSRHARDAYFDSDGSGNIRVSMSYDPLAVASLKMIVPASDRKYSGQDKTWTIRAQYLSKVTDMLRSHGYGVYDHVQDVGEAEAERVARMVLQVNYLGNVRRRRDGSLTASGMNERGEWEYIFPWPVLADWFDIGVTPASTANLYDRLAVSPQATAAEIKKAYRQLVRVWHPDVSDHPAAGDAFRALDEAYKTLTDERARKKYEFALSLAGQMDKATPDATMWVPPANCRCGHFTCDVERGLNRLTVIQIHDIDAIVNSAGQEMTAVWSMADNAPVFDWR